VRAAALALLLSGCLADGLGYPEPPAPDEPCCVERDGQLVCRSNRCPELGGARECETLADTDPHYCQVPLTDDCRSVYLQETGASTRKPFQTVYCF
jgi:hypothetical protein